MNRLPFDQLKESSRYSRLWREKHPDKAEVLIEKANAAESAKRKLRTKANFIMDKQKEFQAATVKNPNSYRVREILRMHARGRDIGTIVVATGLPMSIVTKVISNQTQANV